MNQKPPGQTRTGGHVPGILALRPFHAGRAGEAGSPARFDAAKVDRVRSALADGSYRIDAERIAKRLLSD